MNVVEIFLDFRRFSADGGWKIKIGILIENFHNTWYFSMSSSSVGVINNSWAPRWWHFKILQSFNLSRKFLFFIPWKSSLHFPLLQCNFHPKLNIYHSTLHYHHHCCFWPSHITLNHFFSECEMEIFHINSKILN